MKTQHHNGTNPSPFNARSTRDNWNVLTDQDITDDVERIITKLALPYVSDTHPLLALDELRGECRWRLAKLIDSGVLRKCLTRAKVFAYIKVALKNHLRSYVSKLIFTTKRGGIGLKKSTSVQKSWHRTKAVHCSLDDVEQAAIGFRDHRIETWCLLEDIIGDLSPREASTLRHLIAPGTSHGRERFDMPSPQEPVSEQAPTKEDYLNLKSRILQLFKVV